MGLDLSISHSATQTIRLTSEHANIVQSRCGNNCRFKYKEN